MAIHAIPVILGVILFKLFVLIGAYESFLVTQRKSFERARDEFLDKIHERKEELDDANGGPASAFVKTELDSLNELEAKMINAKSNECVHDALWDFVRDVLDGYMEVLRKSGSIMYSSAERLVCKMQETTKELIRSIEGVDDNKDK